MPPTSKPPVPPSFYSKLPGMTPGAGAGAAGGADPAAAAGGAKPAPEEEVKIVDTLFKVFEKWRKAAGDDKDKGAMIQQMADTLQKYNEKFVAKDGAAGGQTKPPQPSDADGQGAAPGGGAGGGAGMETQPVPA